MISHAQLLSFIAPDLYLPITLLFGALAIRATFYLYLYYNDYKIKFGQICHTIYVLSHLVTLLDVLLGFYKISTDIIATGFQPSTVAVTPITLTLIATVIISSVPFYILYKSDKSK